MISPSHIHAYDWVLFTALLGRICHWAHGGCYQAALHCLDCIDIVQWRKRIGRARIARNQTEHLRRLAIPRACDLFVRSRGIRGRMPNPFLVSRLSTGLGRYRPGSIAQCYGGGSVYGLLGYHYRVDLKWRPWFLTALLASPTIPRMPFLDHSSPAASPATLQSQVL